MLKYQVATRTFYSEDPMTAGRPVNGTSISMLAVENGGPYLIGDTPVVWDPVTESLINTISFAHYENRRYTEDEATATFEGKCDKLIADGYVFEAYMDMAHFMRTGEILHKVERHT